jgi:hypothetical protein
LGRMNLITTVHASKLTHCEIQTHGATSNAQQSRSLTMAGQMETAALIVREFE